MIFSIVANAQIPTNTNWNLGIDFGATYSALTTTQLHAKRGDYGITGGITALYKFNNNITTEIGLRLTSKGASKLTNFAPQYSHFLEEMTIEQMNYIDIPLMIGYNIKVNGKFSFTPKVGAYFAYGYGGKSYIEGSNGQFGASLLSPFEDNSFTLGDGTLQSVGSFENIDYGVNIGLDLNFQQFTLRVAYNWGLNELFNTYDTGNYTRSLSLSLGYYIFKKR